MSAEPTLQPPPSPSQQTVVTPQSSTAPLPLRSGSRASRISSSSRFSSARLPFAGTSGAAKAVATTALASEQIVPGSPDSLNSPPSDVLSASPEGSPTEGLSNFLPHHRRRTSSYQPARQSPLIQTMGLPTMAVASSSSAMNGVDGPAGVPPPASGLTARTRLASLASSWGVSFGRKARGTDATGPPGVSGTAQGGDQ